MRKQILNHYLKFGLFTSPGLYKELLVRDLPNDLRQIGKLVRASIIHQVELKKIATKLPWFRQPEDAILTTAASMLAELYRRDERGFRENRAIKDKLILTCRPVAILTASILKSKGIPARVRSGFAFYFPGYGNKRVDHWINQYWDKEKHLWVTIDVDGSGIITTFDPYDLPDGVFDYSADAWINAREAKVDPNHFWNAGGYKGLMVIAWELFYDFHCLMNSEIIYLHHPAMTMHDVFPTITEQELKKIDDLARVMQKPDENFNQLREIWNTNKTFRLLKGVLLYTV